MHTQYIRKRKISIKMIEMMKCLSGVLPTYDLCIILIKLMHSIKPINKPPSLPPLILNSFSNQMRKGK